MMPSLTATTQHQSVQIDPLADAIRAKFKEPFPEPGASHNMRYIHSEEDFHAKMDAYDQEFFSPDLDDLPSDAETQQALVQQLVEAI